MSKSNRWNYTVVIRNWRAHLADSESGPLDTQELLARVTPTLVEDLYLTYKDPCLWDAIVDAEHIPGFKNKPDFEVWLRRQIQRGEYLVSQPTRSGSKG